MPAAFNLDTELTDLLHFLTKKYTSMKIWPIITTKSLILGTLEEG